MTTTTTNYGWIKPVVGGDEDLWGTEVNTTLDDIDADLKAVADAAAPISAAAFAAQAAPGVSLTGYNAYRVTYHGLIPSGNPTLSLQLSFDDGATWKSGASDYAYAILSVTNLAGVNLSNGATSFRVTQNAIDSTASKANAVTIEIYGPRAAGFGSTIRTEAEYWSSGNNEWDISRGQIVPGYGAPTNVRLVCSTGTLTGDTVVTGLAGF